MQHKRMFRLSENKDSTFLFHRLIVFVRMVHTFGGDHTFVCWAADIHLVRTI